MVKFAEPCGTRFVDRGMGGIKLGSTAQGLGTGRLGSNRIRSAEPAPDSVPIFPGINCTLCPGWALETASIPGSVLVSVCILA